MASKGKRGGFGGLFINKSPEMTGGDYPGLFAEHPEFVPLTQYYNSYSNIPSSLNDNFRDFDKVDVGHVGDMDKYLISQPETLQKIKDMKDDEIDGVSLGLNPRTGRYELLGDKAVFLRAKEEGIDIPVSIKLIDKDNMLMDTQTFLKSAMDNGIVVPRDVLKHFPEIDPTVKKYTAPDVKDITKGNVEQIIKDYVKYNNKGVVSLYDVGRNDSSPQKDALPFNKHIINKVIDETLHQNYPFVQEKKPVIFDKESMDKARAKLGEEEFNKLYHVKTLDKIMEGMKDKGVTMEKIFDKVPPAFKDYLQFDYPAYTSDHARNAAMLAANYLVARYAQIKGLTGNDEITVKQQVALNDYKGEGYKYMNAYLNNPKAFKAEKGEERTNEIKGKISEINKMMRPLKDDMVLYKGVRMDRLGDFDEAKWVMGKNLPDTVKPGNIVKIKELWSTSGSVDTSARFTGYGGYAMIRLFVPKGTPVVQVEHALDLYAGYNKLDPVKNEGEMLLAPNFKARVLSSKVVTQPQPAGDKDAPMIGVIDMEIVK